MKQPKTGIKIVQEYDYVVGNYFGNKELKKDQQINQIQRDTRKAAEIVQENRQKYEKLQNAKVFRPKNLQREKIKKFRETLKQSQSVVDTIKNNS